MSKIGVGVGDDFPVDDGNNPNNTNNTNSAGATAGPRTPEDDRAEFEEWKRRRDAHRAQKEQWHAQREEWHRRKHEWKAQWREGKRAFRDEMRSQFADDDARGYGGRRYGRGRFPYPLAYGLPRILGVILVIAVVIFALTHIGYILAGLAAIALLWAAYHHFGHDMLDVGPYGRRGYGPRDYGRPINNPPPAPTQAVAKPADNTNTNNNGQQNT